MLHKEIIVFSCGDSNDICTWSNVPYLFCKTLEEKGWVLHRVDISPNKLLNRLFTSTSYLIFRRILRLGACPEYHRFWLHRFLTRRKIRKATTTWPNIDFNLFLSFAFYNLYSKSPNVLWCDWTDAVVIERLGRTPKWYERASLQHETRVMQCADAVYTLFPICSQDLSARYNRPVIYLNRNVVNTVYQGHFPHLSPCKQQNHRILFIGNLRYLGAANLLIQVFHEIKKIITDAELHIIGMTANHLGGANLQDVHCYGYLHKNEATECARYYQLIFESSVLVNPAAKWAAYSSMVEAMYYNTPVIVSPYDDFVADFGDNIDFGFYMNRPSDLRSLIMQVLTMDSNAYVAMCRAAHSAVKDYTWEKYINVFLGSLRQQGIIC
jgi:glycosyltransferase involved in cell wall biosynthesis